MKLDSSHHVEVVPVDPFGCMGLEASYCVENVHQQNQTDPTVVVPDLSMKVSSLDHVEVVPVDPFGCIGLEA